MQDSEIGENIALSTHNAESIEEMREDYYDEGEMVIVFVSWIIALQSRITKAKFLQANFADGANSIDGSHYTYNTDNTLCSDKNNNKRELSSVFLKQICLKRKTKISVDNRGSHQCVECDNSYHNRKSLVRHQRKKHAGSNLFSVIFGSQSILVLLFFFCRSSLPKLRSSKYWQFNE